MPNHIFRDGNWEPLSPNGGSAELLSSGWPIRQHSTFADVRAVPSSGVEGMSGVEGLYEEVRVAGGHVSVVEEGPHF